MKEEQKWTDEQANYIEKYFMKKDDIELAEDLGLSIPMVKKIRSKLGLKKQRQTVHKDAPKGMKWCWRCEEFHPLDDFSNNRRKKDGKQDECKKAVKQILLEKKMKKENNKNKIELKEKTCQKCNKVKEIKHFKRNVSTKDGYSNLCVDCLNENDILRKFKSEGDSPVNNKEKNTKNQSRNTVYRNVYGNVIKSDPSKFEDVDIEAIIADVKNTNKNIGCNDSVGLSLEIRTNINSFMSNIGKYIYNKDIYKLNEMNKNSKDEVLLSIEELNKTIDEIKNIIKGDM